MAIPQLEPLRNVLSGHRGPEYSDNSVSKSRACHLSPRPSIVPWAGAAISRELFLWPACVYSC